MAGFLKKCGEDSKKTRAILVFVYVLATIIASLNHTCNQSQPKLHCSRHSSDCCMYHPDEYAEAQLQIKPSYNSYTTITLPHSHYCPGCLYRLTSKTSQVHLPIAFATAEKVITLQSQLHSSFTNQSEWFSSVSLRGPPLIIS